MTAYYLHVVQLVALAGVSDIYIYIIIYIYIYTVVHVYPVLTICGNVGRVSIHANVNCLLSYQLCLHFLSLH